MERQVDFAKNYCTHGILKKEILSPASEMEKRCTVADQGSFVHSICLTLRSLLEIPLIPCLSQKTLAIDISFSRLVASLRRIEGH